MSTALDPNLSAKIPAGNPPSPKNNIWIVTSLPKEISETKTSVFINPKKAVKSTL